MYGIPSCQPEGLDPADLGCNLLRILVGTLDNVPGTQAFWIQAQVGKHVFGSYLFWKSNKSTDNHFQYWHDPLKPFVYAMNSQFIGLINNENPLRFDKTYAENLAKLENFVLVMFDEDAIVIPKEQTPSL